jgi:hypothetical protein
MSWGEAKGTGASGGAFSATATDGSSSGSSGPPVRYARKVPLTVEEQESIAPAVRTVVQKKRGKGKLIAAIAVVAAVVVVAALGYLYFFKKGAANTPEDAFTEFVNAINDRDSQRVIDVTVLHFADSATKQNEKDGLELWWSQNGDMHVTINSVTAIMRGDMSASQLQGLDDIVTQVEQLYSIDVVDSCGIHFNTTTTLTGETPYTNEDIMPCVKIGSSWYIPTIVPY